MSNNDNNDIWTQKRPDRKWENKKSGNDRASSVHDTQAEAIERGSELARNNRSEHIIKGKDGKIREKNSYGNDPYPPKG